MLIVNLDLLESLVEILNVLKKKDTLDLYHITSNGGLYKITLGDVVVIQDFGYPVYNWLRFEIYGR